MSYTLIIMPQTKIIKFDSVTINLLELPKFSFNYDVLLYETIHDNYYYYIDNNRFILTDSQKLECLNYCKEFIKNKDYDVYIYGKNKIFNKKVLKSIAIEEKETYTTKAPNAPVSKWNGIDWEEVIITVTEDGTIFKNPARILFSMHFIFNSKRNWKNS